MVAATILALVAALATCAPPSQAWTSSGSSRPLPAAVRRTAAPPPRPPSSLSAEPFSLRTLFGRDDAAPPPKRSVPREPHPMYPRAHISPLNSLLPLAERAASPPVAAWSAASATSFEAEARDASDDAAPGTLLRAAAAGEDAAALPVHPDVVSGVLPNGFSYVILPNASPAGRFEAHLQVFSGSSDELESQQGMAHLTEHVAYMGSRKRERLFGTGSQTNAYTDFHHTVFYAACPVISPLQGVGGGRNRDEMLPLALDALCEVMEARVEGSRLEKERQAVLSEMTMVNTIEYRVECQILQTLHRENRLAKRFPIGKENLIRSWTKGEVKDYHRCHYRPDNVLLYIVGDVDVEHTRKNIADTFGHLTAEGQGADVKDQHIRKSAGDLASAVHGTVKATQSWHYPAVAHTFVGVTPEPPPLVEPADYDIHLQSSYELDERVETLATSTTKDGKPIRPHIYRHELLQSFSLHLFAKRVVEPVVNLADFRKSIARRIVLAALQIRLNVNSRGDNPPFSFVEFNQLDSAREGCAVCSLDVMSDPSRWEEAIAVVLREVKKLGVHGITEGEMGRYAGSLLTDAGQLAAMGDNISHGDQLAYLMETVACGHTFMSADQSYEATEAALRTLSVQEVNAAAAELCSHVTSLGSEVPVADGPVIAIACCPRTPEEATEGYYCTEEKLVAAISAAADLPVEPNEDMHVPRTLVDDDDVAAAVAAYPPQWTPGVFSDGTPPTPADKVTSPFTLRRLSNGVRVGVAASPAESQRGHLRLVVPGGRDREAELGLRPGSMVVGARTMQEGGAFGRWTREQVELFCVDHLIMVEINCNEEFLSFDFVFPTNEVGNVGFGDDIEMGITGTEAVLQILREIIVGFVWEEDALWRSKQNFYSTHDGLSKNLEGMSTEKLMTEMTQNDPRFLSIDSATVDAITLDDARTAVMSQLVPSELEISMIGDFPDVGEILEMVKTFVGTIPPDQNRQYVPTPATGVPDVGRVPALPAKGKHLDFDLLDSDPRAVAYVSGGAPNRWGVLADGTTVAERAAQLGGSDYDKSRRNHPLYANVALALISEIVNRRLFSYVRERKQLTYDANFHFTGFERLAGGWFLVTVTASVDKAQAALDACKETLRAIRSGSPITVDNLESAKRVVINRHEGEMRTTRYLSEMLTGLQFESIPLKGPSSITDFNGMVQSMNAKDLQFVLGCVNLADDELFTAIGKTVQPEGANPQEGNDDEVLRTVAVVPGRRGGALN